MGGDGPLDPLEDAWMLRQFPGRTLDELDEIDLARHVKAWTAESVQAQASTVKRWMEKKASAEELQQVEPWIRKRYVESWHKRRVKHGRPTA